MRGARPIPFQSRREALTCSEKIPIFGADHVGKTDEINLIPDNRDRIPQDIDLSGLAHTPTSTMVMVSFPKISTTLTAILRRPGRHS